MRKFIILLAVVMLMIGVRLQYNWISHIEAEGILTVYHKGGEITTYTDGIPVLLKWNEPVRLDIAGGKDAAEGVLTALSAKILWTENFDSLTVIYAYSGKICGYSKVLGQKVNLMIAVGDYGVAIGSPILKGSY